MLIGAMERLRCESKIGEKCDDKCKVLFAISLMFILLRFVHIFNNCSQLSQFKQKMVRSELEHQFSTPAQMILLLKVAISSLGYFLRKLDISISVENYLNVYVQMTF